MQNYPNSQAQLLASLCPDYHDGRPALDRILLAVDLLRVIHLALRAEAYHDDRKDLPAIADVTLTAVDLLDNARALLRQPSHEDLQEGGADAE